MSVWYVLCVCVCECCDCRSLCGPIAPPVHGFMNILLWAKSPCSDAQTEGEREREATNLSQQR